MTQDELIEMLSDFGLDLEGDVHADNGSSSEMTYSYYFNVPSDADKEALIKHEMTPGQRVEIPLNTFDENEDID